MESIDTIDACTVCNKQLEEEPWYAVATGDIGELPHERFEVIMCGKCAFDKLSPDFRKTVKALFEEYG